MKDLEATSTIDKQSGLKSKFTEKIAPSLAGLLALSRKAWRAMAVRMSLWNLLLTSSWLWRIFGHGFWRIVSLLWYQTWRTRLWSWWVWQTGVKTPVAQALSMAMSEYWLLVDQKDDEMLPSFRLAASLDQLRGDPGIKYRPDILDDADTSMVPVAKLKSFLDSSVAEAFTVERWTAAKFVRNQLRIICVPRLCFTHFCLQYCLASAVVEFCCVCETQEIFRASCNLSPEGSLMVWNPRAIGKSPSNNPF